MNAHQRHRAALLAPLATVTGLVLSALAPVAMADPPEDPAVSRAAVAPGYQLLIDEQLSVICMNSEGGTGLRRWWVRQSEAVR